MNTTTKLMLALAGSCLMAAFNAMAEFCPRCGVDIGDVPHTARACQERLRRIAGEPEPERPGNSQADQLRQIQEWRRQQREQQLENIRRSSEAIVTIQEMERRRRLEAEERAERELREEALRTEVEIMRDELQRRQSEPSTLPPIREYHPPANDYVPLLQSAPSPGLTAPAPARPLLREPLGSLFTAASPPAAAGPAAPDDVAARMALAALVSELLVNAVVDMVRGPDTPATDPGPDSLRLLNDLLPNDPVSDAAVRTATEPGGPPAMTSIFFWLQKRADGFGFSDIGPRAAIARDSREAARLMETDLADLPNARAGLTPTDLGLSALDRAKPGFVIVGYNTHYTPSEGIYLNPTTLSAVCGLPAMADVVGPKGLGSFNQPTRFLCIFKNNGQPNFGASPRCYSYVNGQWEAAGEAEVPVELQRHHWLTKPYSPGFADDPP